MVTFCRHTPISTWIVKTYFHKNFLLPCVFCCCCCILSIHVFEFVTKTKNSGNLYMFTGFPVLNEQFFCCENFRNGNDFWFWPYADGAGGREQGAGEQGQGSLDNCTAFEGEELGIRLGTVKPLRLYEYMLNGKWNATTAPINERQQLAFQFRTGEMLPRVGNSVSAGMTLTTWRTQTAGRVSEKFRAERAPANAGEKPWLRLVPQFASWHLFERAIWGGIKMNDEDVNKPD